MIISSSKFFVHIINKQSHDFFVQFGINEARAFVNLLVRIYSKKHSKPCDLYKLLSHQDCNFLGSRTFAPIATAHFFAQVTHTSCIEDNEGKHDAKGAKNFHKNGT